MNNHNGPLRPPILPARGQPIAPPPAALLSQSAYTEVRRETRRLELMFSRRLPGGTRHDYIRVPETQTGLVVIEVLTHEVEELIRRAFLSSNGQMARGGIRVRVLERQKITNETPGEANT